MNGRSGMKPSDAFAASASVATSWPLTTMRPDVGFSSPAIMRMVVVLPAPFGPRKPWISPLDTSRLTPSTAVNDPYFFTRPSTRIMDLLPPRRRPTAASGGVAPGNGDVERAEVRRLPPDQDGNGPRPELHVEHVDLRVADQGQDGRLLFEASPGQPD